MILHILSDVLIFVSSTVKFALLTFTVITGNLGISGTVANVLGGLTGIIVFTYMGTYMRTWVIKTFPDRFDRKFTKGTRFLVKVRKHSGLFGVAFMTPIFLSIPVGVMLALSLTSHKRKIVTSMIVSCMFWSAVMFVPYYAFSINVIGWVKHMF
ncbi:MAG: hypothetical protein JWO03_1101 [Bacteroidetes bacterium]|nr:hypothetical protein [Bacteroidota bacterium]